MTTDYKSTLNLPQTHFPMKANLTQREPKQLSAWQAMDLYGKLRAKHAQAPRYIVHDGPPYANGRPHVGHAMNKIIKDLIAKAKSLSGFDAPMVPGWDCHGLPIELNVEKKVGKPGPKISADDFRQACRKYAQQQVNIQSEDFQRLGVLGDWANPYLTMDYAYEADTVRVLGQLLAQGTIVRGRKPVYWCPLCASALAEAEVEYQDKTSPAIDVGFAVIDSAEMAARFAIPPVSNAVSSPLWMPIWTTTPWTLPANQAVAVHPDITYVWVLAVDDVADERQLIVAQDLLSDVLSRYGWQEKTVLGTVRGDALLGTMLRHPFNQRDVPVVAGAHVTTDAGTGCVHIAPAHGLDDYMVGLQEKLPVDNLLDARSCFFDTVEPVGGCHVFKANEPILAHLKDCGTLLHEALLTHSYPHCWRHKTPVIFRATPQWFISMSASGLRDKALSQVTDHRWIPAWGEKRMQQMLASRPDWCISRQRTWGTPIAFIVHRDTGDCHPRMIELIEPIAKRIEQGGVDAWYALDLQDLIGDEASHYEKVTDILDVWFDSGVSHACVLEKRTDLNRPADLYFEGSDQFRGWFQSSLLTGVALTGQAPFRTVLTHGYVVDAKGHKMSKSRGNVIAPADVVKQLGADVLRLWVASSNYQNELNVSTEILKRSTDAYRRLRNTARYLLSNLADFSPERDLLNLSECVAIDQWIVSRAQQLQHDILRAYDDFQFHVALQAIHLFCTEDLGGVYLDITKDRQYTAAAGGLARRSAQTATYYVCEALVHWLAPIISFTADEIWQYMPGKRAESVFLSEWPQWPEVVLSQTLDWPWLLSMRQAVNAALEQARKQGVIGGALDAIVTIQVASSHMPMMQSLAAELHFFCLCSKVTLATLDVNVPTSEHCAECAVQVAAIDAPKCARCWQRVDSVGSHASHPDICQRCVINITDASGESRQFF